MSETFRGLEPENQKRAPRKSMFEGVMGSIRYAIRIVSIELEPNPWVRKLKQIRLALNAAEITMDVAKQRFLVLMKDPECTDEDIKAMLHYADEMYFKE